MLREKRFELDWVGQIFSSHEPNERGSEQVLNKMIAK